MRNESLRERAIMHQGTPFPFLEDLAPLVAPLTGTHMDVEEGKITMILIKIY